MYVMYVYVFLLIFRVLLFMTVLGCECMSLLVAYDLGDEFVCVCRCVYVMLYVVCGSMCRCSNVNVFYAEFFYLRVTYVTCGVATVDFITSICTFDSKLSGI
jgi:hypothetical protein